jgi:hypothetical protein
MLYYIEAKIYSEKDNQIFPEKVSESIFSTREPRAPREVESIYDIKNEIIPICIIPKEPVKSTSKVEKYGINSQYCTVIDNDRARLKFSKILEYNDQIGIPGLNFKAGVSRDYGYNMEYYHNTEFLNTLKENTELQEVWRADQELVDKMVDEEGKSEFESVRQEAYDNFGGKKTHRRKTKRGKKINNKKTKRRMRNSTRKSIRK